LLIVVCANRIFAQTASEIQRDIIGAVFEKSDNNTNETSLPGANVCLLNARDSSLITGIAADANGKFIFTGVKQGNYILSASFVSYATAYKPVPAELFKTNHTTINLGKIVLEESAISMKGVTITGQIPEVVVKEDTIEYNAGAFKVADGAVVEDLLKQMPGMEVDPEGKITNSGKEIKRVFVNGKQFFGNDPKMATKNLTADMIDKVQVIEKQTDEAEQTGVDDGEREVIINLIVKKNKMHGWMGNITAGGGPLIDDRTNAGLRYTSQAMLNKFTENSQISFIVNSNNINNPGFTDRGNTVRANIGGGGGGGNGITNSNNFGVNISTLVSPKFKIGGNVRYGYSENFSKNNSFRTNLLKDSVSYRKNASEGRNYSHNASIAAKMEYKPDSLYTIEFRATASKFYNFFQVNHI
jgi:hypothetical protein